MLRGPECDEELLQRLPLPLARLYRLACNAKSPLDLHQAAYFLWEASLKLLASGAIVVYAERPDPAPQITEKLTNLARPALGHWWELVRLLVPALADVGEPGYVAVREQFAGKARADLPRAAGLDGALREALDSAGGARATVRLPDLFERLVRYRNRELGHGAPGQRPDEFYERVGRALLAGVSEVLGRLDVLAGRRLIHVSDVRRETGGNWMVERDDLTGEAVRRLTPLRVPDAASASLPRPGRLYLEACLSSRGTLAALKSLFQRGGTLPPATMPGLLVCLHPLAVFDAESEEVLFLNSRRGRGRTEYLCYSSGRAIEQQDLAGAQRELLAKVLDMPVDAARVEEWGKRAGEGDVSAPEAATESRRTIGEFEVLGELGSGGMGVVHRAWQSSVGRQVALKCLLKTRDARSEGRFGREIRALGRVSHPNLVKVFTSGSDGDFWFYAMELVEGTTLAALCAHQAPEARTWQQALSTTGDGAPPPAPVASIPPRADLPALPVKQIVELVRQVAEAAHALHEAGVVHRDVKPGNVVVSPDGERAVLLDLGLAQLADEGDGKLTRTRQFVGTLRYASPEQVLAAGQVDRRSDVYSLGATLWECLTLQPLYAAVEETAPPELMRRIQFEEPASPRKHRPDVPADLDAVVLHCLEKMPQRRYASARELADDLGRWARGEPVQARRSGWAYRAAKFVRRRRFWIALVLGLLALQGALGYLFYRLGQAGGR